MVGNFRHRLARSICLNVTHLSAALQACIVIQKVSENGPVDPSSPGIIRSRCASDKPQSSVNVCFIQPFSQVANSSVLSGDSADPTFKLLLFVFFGRDVWCSPFLWETNVMEQPEGGPFLKSLEQWYLTANWTQKYLVCFHWISGCGCNSLGCWLLVRCLIYFDMVQVEMVQYHTGSSSCRVANQAVSDVVFIQVKCIRGIGPLGPVGTRLGKGMDMDDLVTRKSSYGRWKTEI